MRIDATVSQFHRDVLRILEDLKNNNSQNTAVSDLSPLRHCWVNSNHRPGSELDIGSRLPGDSPSRTT